MAVLDFLKRKKGSQGPRPPKRGESASQGTGRYPASPDPRAQAEAVAKVGEAKDKKKPEGEPQNTVVLRESRTAWRILKEPHVTEKSTNLTQFNQYVFKIIRNPSKQEIKKSIEEVYGVHVDKVRKTSVPGKKRRRGRHVGWKPGYKKAIVTLREGEKIEVLPH